MMHRPLNIKNTLNYFIIIKHNGMAAIKTVHGSYLNCILTKC